MDAPYRGLPRELIQHILDILDEEDPRALKTCSYVDHLFCILAQMRLLRRIKLRQIYHDVYPSICSDIGYSPSIHFLQVLDKSPHIATYIRSLTIEGNWPWQYRENRHWLEADNALSELLPRLVNLCGVSVRASEDERLQIQPLVPPLTWNMAQQGLKVLFSKVYANRFTELDLRGIDEFPVEFLQHCTAIKRLSITSLSFDPEKLPSKKPSPVPQLEYLHLEISNHVDELAQYFSHPSFPIDLTRLETLSVHPSMRQTFEHLVSFSTCAMSATNLHIHARDLPVSVLYNVLNYPLEQRTMAIPDLRGFASLRSVTIDALFRIRIFTHQSLIDYFTSPLAWIARLFKSMAEFPPLAEQISHLTLNLAFSQFSTQLVRLIRWEELSNSISKFPRPVKLFLNITGLDGKDITELENDERLSGLAKNGCLVTSSY